VAARNRNRLAARSSLYRNIAILAVHPTDMMPFELEKNCNRMQFFG
jgi:hypothetical protein